MTELTKEEAHKLLSGLVADAEAALTQAELFADEHRLLFDFSPAYGMGGTYYGDPNHGDLKYHGLEGAGGWISSSDGC